MIWNRIKSWFTPRNTAQKELAERLGREWDEFIVDQIRRGMDDQTRETPFVPQLPLL